MHTQGDKKLLSGVNIAGRLTSGTPEQAPLAQLVTKLTWSMLVVIDSAFQLGSNSKFGEHHYSPAAVGQGSTQVCSQSSP